MHYLQWRIWCWKDREHEKSYCLLRLRRRNQQIYGEEGTSEKQYAV